MFGKSAVFVALLVLNLDGDSQLNTIKLLSYNIHKGFSLTNSQYTLELIKKGIQESAAELLCLQEVCGHSNHSHKEKLHPTSTQFEFLADGVWSHYAYGKNSVYKKGHHGNLILSKYPIVAHHNLDISNNRFERRGLLHAKLQLPSNNFLHVMTAHLDLFENGRQKQKDKIINYVRASVGQSDRLLLAGDFNDWRQSLTLQFQQELQLKEAFLETNNQHAKTFPSFSPFLCLDRIYFKNLKVLECECLDGDTWSRLSDHTPLSSVFEF
jgi:endonuclease/exonuclease/phosphatase family metal-dependent hydrolase